MSQECLTGIFTIAKENDIMNTLDFNEIIKNCIISKARRVQILWFYSW